MHANYRDVAQYDKTRINYAGCITEPDLDGSYQYKIKLYSSILKAKGAFVYLTENKYLIAEKHSMAISIPALRELLERKISSLPSFHSDLSLNSYYFEPQSDENESKFGIFFHVLLSEEKTLLGLIGAVIPQHLMQTDFANLSAENKEILDILAKDCAKQVSQDRAFLRLVESNNQQFKISNLNKDYICVKNTLHKIVYANEAFINTFPVASRNSIVGSDASAFYDADTSAQIIDSDLVALKEGAFKRTEQLLLPNGSEKILLTTKESFVAIDGQKYIVSISRDITEKEVLIRDLKRSNSDLDNFAYVASHDLRSPLNVIKRLMTWVKEDCRDILPLDSLENVDLVLSRVERMEKLLMDLLSYSRIGKEYQESSTINLRESVVELLSLIDLPMGFVVNCDDVELSVPVVPFNVVILNLISNAIKHHDSGNAKIEIKAKTNNKGCTISIVDNGPGIEQEDRERIFKLFETLKPRDEVEGSGMGLSVVKKIIEHYGGSIHIEENLPRGTKFVFMWPLSNIAQNVRQGLTHYE